MVFVHLVMHTGGHTNYVHYYLENMEWQYSINLPVFKRLVDDRVIRTACRRRGSTGKPLLIQVDPSSSLPMMGKGSPLLAASILE